LVEEGIITDVSGDEKAEAIWEKMEDIRSGLRPSKAAMVGNFAEFGFGMNPRAKIIGNPLEDLVSRGAIYFGFGNNMALGGTVNVPLHIRGVCRKATLALEDVDLLVEGKVTAKVR
jgi:leucyl aminopeptidase (aminopeptidase T)